MTGMNKPPIAGEVASCANPENCPEAPEEIERQIAEKIKQQIPREWLPNEGATRVLSVLNNDIDRENGEAISHSIRSLRVLSMFGKDVNENRRLSMASAMLLHDVLGRILHREDSGRAQLSDGLSKELIEFIKEMSKNDMDKVPDFFAYMHDQVAIGVYAREYRSRCKSEADVNRGAMLGELNDPNYDGMVNVEGWKTDIDAIRSEEMEKLSKEVNIESLIIKASEMLDNLKYAPPSDSQQLRNILEAESFYIPMLEALGYDAMAAEMASTCHIYRLEGQGRFEEVERAAEIYKQYKKIDPAMVLQKVLNLEHEPSIKWIVNETSDNIKQGINCRFAETSISLNGTECRVLFRQKSIGSLAKKLVKKGGDYNLMDVFGFQVIVDDDEPEDRRHYEMSDADIEAAHSRQVDKLAGCFRGFAETVLSNSEQFHLTSTNRYREPIFVQGDNSYIEILSSMFNNENIGKIVDSRGSVPYRVAKATGGLILDDSKSVVPVEIQMITRVDREYARTGETNHTVYKIKKNKESKTAEGSKEKNKSLRWIQSLHKRMGFMKSGEGNPISRASSMQALTALFRGLYPSLFSSDELYGKNRKHFEGEGSVSSTLGETAVRAV